MLAFMALLDQMKDEKSGAYEYAKCAIKYKNSDPTLAWPGLGWSIIANCLDKLSVS